MISKCEYESNINNNDNIFDSLFFDAIDSMQMYWAKYDMAGISIRSDLTAGIKDKLNDILNFADRSQNEKLKDYKLSLYRTYLIEKSDFGGFSTLY